jgi:hypothetical protein
MSRARFRFDNAILDGPRKQSGTVTIDRGSGLFSVRPLHSRREYILPLSLVASIVTARVIRAEVSEKKKAKT